MKEPLVSIVMPVYNGETTLRLAVHSLIAQSYRNWECVVVNDGSTDGTKAFLDSIEDERFHIIHLPINKGRGYAREIGLENVKGVYITYLDADDMIHSEKLYRQTVFMETHKDIGLVGCGGITMDKDYIPLQVFTMTNIVVSSGRYKYGEPLPLLMASVMVRGQRAKEIRYDKRLDVGEDFEYFSRYLDGSQYANLPLPYYYYLTGTYTGRKIIDYQLKVLKMWKKLMINGAMLRGCMGMLTTIFKIMAYSILLPIFGADRLMNSRGHGASLTDEQKKEFEKQLKNITNLAL